MQNMQEILNKEEVLNVEGLSLALIELTNQLKFTVDAKNGGFINE